MSLKLVLLAVYTKYIPDKYINIIYIIKSEITCCAKRTHTYFQINTIYASIVIVSKGNIANLWKILVVIQWIFQDFIENHCAWNTITNIFNSLKHNSSKKWKF